MTLFPSSVNTFRAGLSVDDLRTHAADQAFNASAALGIPGLGLSGSFAMPMDMERCWYYSGTYCALGVALPMAIGAKIGAPHRAVIAVAGDGGFMFTVNELATAAEERLALPVIVWNNDALNAIVEQMDLQQVPRIGVEPKSPDFLQLAQSLGCHAFRAASAEHLAQSVRDALVADRPTLIEVRQDSPWLITARAVVAPVSGR